MTFHGRHSWDAPRTGRNALAHALVLSAACIAAPLAALGQEAAAGPGMSAQSIATILPQHGDPGGARKALAARGVTYELNYFGAWQGNLAGGLSQGGAYIGRLDGVIDADLGKLMGWRGLTLHAHGFQIHGDGLSPEHIGNLLTVSYLEALPTTRLFELWLEQRMLGDSLTLRFGQLAADTEFMTSSYAAQLINGTFGWSAITAADLPSGGPGYPFATPAVRLKLDPAKNVSLLLGVFNGDPAGPGEGDPQTRNRYGLNFRVQDPALVFVEGQYRYNQHKGAAGLAGTIKLGAWGHFGLFDDQRFDAGGLSLADPTSTGNPAKLRGDHAVYAVIDQQIWRPATGEADKGIGVFARVSAAPADRNLIDLYLDGGIVLAGVFPWRPEDVLSFGAAFARISSHARQLDVELGLGVVRDFEALFEVNYEVHVVTGLQIDLNLQRIINPGGNVPGPGGVAIPDATVLTLHTSIKY